MAKRSEHFAIRELEDRRTSQPDRAVRSDPPLLREIGLLSPSCRIDGYHRLYTAGDVARLQQIKSLRYLGRTLKEIRDRPDRSDFSPYRTVQLHISRLRNQVGLQRKLCEEISAEGLFKG